MLSTAAQPCGGKDHGRNSPYHRDIMQRIIAALDSTGMSSSCTLASNGITVELARTNSPYKYHRSSQYDYTNAEVVDPNVLYATNCRSNRLLVTARDYLTEEQSEQVLQPDSEEEIVHGIVPKVFAESLLSSAYEHLRFTALGKHSLVEVWVIRKQLAYFTDGGKPVYVGEEWREEAEEEATV